MNITTESIELIRQLIRFIGDNPDRAGLENTPQRVLRSYQELFSGYQQNPAEILATRFNLTEQSGEMVLSRDIEFYSTCEHHLLPFYGTAHIAYLPNDHQVVGISKLSRLVECFARRLQVQERMTAQIAQAIQSHLQPKGVAVVVQAKHICMCARGVNKHNSQMTTTSLLGCFQNDAQIRSEFLQLMKL